jgi:hypothetical protein
MAPVFYPNILQSCTTSKWHNARGVPFTLIHVYADDIYFIITAIKVHSYHEVVQVNIIAALVLNLI